MHVEHTAQIPKRLESAHKKPLIILYSPSYWTEANGEPLLTLSAVVKAEKGHWSTNTCGVCENLLNGSYKS